MSNKKMLTMLVVMLTALTAISAQAGDYTIYGKLHLSLDALNNGDSTEMFLASNISRFGIKGTRELNDNFTFIWQFESFLDMSNFNDSATLANRNSYLGLKGDWGWMKAGIHDTPFKLIGRKVDFFKDELGDFRQTTFGWDRRLDKVLMYGTPDFSGFGLTGFYQLKNDISMADTGALGASATYNNDSFYFGAAYELIQKNNFYVAPSSHWEILNEYQNVEIIDPGFTTPEDATGLRFVGKFTEGDLEIGALFQTLQNRSGMLYTDANVTGDMNTITWGLGFQYAMSEAYRLKAQYYGFDPNTDMDDDNAAMFALGVDHTYAKDLTFYMQFVMTSNGEFTSFPVGGPGHGARIYPFDDGDSTTSTEDPWGISWGMIKTF